MNMIERVARALCRQFANDAKPDRLEAIVSSDWPLFAPAARAAIEAMREPTEGMVEAEAVQAESYFPARVWQAMITAALHEGEG